MYILYAGFIQQKTKKIQENAEKTLEKTNPDHGLQMAPLAIKRCRDITTDIPNMFPASGAPTAPPIIRG